MIGELFFHSIKDAKSRQKKPFIPREKYEWSIHCGKTSYCLGLPQGRKGNRCQCFAF
ncbi:Uncharacterised protein [Neisseria zoodegmatis]|uniref:Transposase n=1 Tax=Neisseria zoodegmatis TaxID=326523 RepID=A0AB38DTV3_9NEIS|nr:Uncharacterised protein [Neisseria zoodegmatis]